MYEESPLIKKNQTQPEEKICTCGCTGQEKAEFKETNKSQSKSDK